MFLLLLPVLPILPGNPSAQVGGASESDCRGSYVAGVEDLLVLLLLPVPLSGIPLFVLFVC